MGEAVILYGRSGVGKSRSLKEFNEDEIFLVQAIKKSLPFRKRFKYSMVSYNVALILDQLAKMPCKTAVIDDAGYIMSSEFMKGHRNLKGNASFELYNDIADHFWQLINGIKALPDDVVVYVIMHEETTDYGETKLRTIGKLLNDKCNIEGMLTIVLRCVIEDGKHIFVTQNLGNDISKSPEEMFELKMPNDLKAVDTAIREYYGWEEEEKTDEEDNTKQAKEN